MQLIILASGRGLRLGKYTRNKPKCLVNVCNNAIISYIMPIFKFYKEVIFISGYKSEILQNYLKYIPNLIFIENLNFSSTNMVESLFICNKYVKDDVVISYSDIIFDLNILKILNKCTRSTIPIYKNWLKLWKKRMNKNEILNDAEELKFNNKKITMIGEKIEKKLPQYQFMGISKLMKNDYKKLSKFYFSCADKKIDFTKFLNMAINKKIIDLYHLKTDKFWMEIDSEKDLSVAENAMKTNFLIQQNMQRF